LVDFEYEELPAVASIEKAIQTDTPLVHEGVTRNIALSWQIKNGDVERVFSEADRIIKQRIYINRAAPVPIEPRACIADYKNGYLTLWITSQNLHIHRFYLANVLGIPERKIRVIAPDFGGGFGAKIDVYNEELILCYASSLLKRPIKWVETRSEHFVASLHGRDFLVDVEFAVTNDAIVLGIRGQSYANMGAYLGNVSPGVASVPHGLILPGPYKIEAFDYTTYAVFTNTLYKHHDT
jgi:carbon-monoxide dehydrogenase large subunit